MKKKKMHKQIKKILLCIILMLICIGYNVNAASSDTTLATAHDQDDYSEIFGCNITNEEDDSDKIVIKCDSNAAGHSGVDKDDLKNLKFSITKINGATTGTGIGKSLTIGGSGIKLSSSLIKNNSLTVEMVSNKKITITIGDDIYTEKVTVKLDYGSSCNGSDCDDRNTGKDQHVASSSIKYNLEKFDSKDKGTEFDCGSASSYGSSYEDVADDFKSKFCYVKAKAYEKESTNVIVKNNTEQNKGTYDSDNKTTSKKADLLKKFEAPNLKCSTNSAKLSVTYKTDKEYYQEVNTSYYYGKETYTLKVGQYKYNYAAGKTKVQDITCDEVCEEAVAVQYGPPVATKAGLCFEYKVKVTSRVNCYVESEPNEPEEYTEACYPSPICYHGTTTYLQGGPNDTYKQCVNECDGGKYTKKCSNKCYKEVYGTTESSKVSKTSLANIPSKTTSNDKISKETSYKNQLKVDSNAGGVYYFGDNGSVYWYDGSNSYSPGQWYVSYYYPGDRYGVFQHDGFYRANYGSAGYCHDSCYWILGKCANDKYLNLGDIKADVEYNTKQYNKAKTACKAEAKCTTETTYFKISVNYREQTTTTDTESESTSCKNKTIVYGNTEVLNSTTTTTTLANDETHRTALKSDETCAKSTDSNEAKYASKNAENIILQSSDCYGKCELTQKYMTEWSFGGTWINKKTGEISYNKPKQSSAWDLYTGKFCLVRDAADVNRKWYYWYQANRESADIDENCICAKEKTATTLSKYNESTKGYEIDYNINARTEEFGFYGWTFNISCFYAKADTCAKDNEKVCNDTPSCGTSVQYKIRTVTNEDLFPSTEGASSSDTATTGRTAGYNWTSQAQLKEKQVPNNYISDPVKILSEIQEKGNTIYQDVTTTSANSNGNVDYYFHLTPENITAIRKYNNSISNGTYNSYCGTIEDAQKNFVSTIPDAKVSVYFSNLFREGKKTNDTFTAGGKNINCNNNAIGEGIITAEKMPSEAQVKMNNINGVGVK